MRNLILAAALLMSVNIYAQNRGTEKKDNSDTAAKPGVESMTDTLPLRQMDGTILHIVGFGNFFVNYSETIDGYTLVLNKAGFYEYATQGEDGSLVPIGLEAKDPGKRTSKERRKLKHISKHLRYTGKTLEKLESKQSKYNQLPKVPKRDK
jgi:hypothetical protein